MDLSDAAKDAQSELESEIWLEELMEAYGDALTKLAYSYLKDWSLAEDAVQDTFVTAYRNRRSRHELVSVKAWIYRITINRCKDMLKSSQMKRVILGTRLFEFMRSKDASPEKRMVAKSEEEAFMEQVFELPVTYREVLLLYYYEELTIPEISCLLDMNENTVKTRMRRGKTRLRALLEGGEFDGREIR